MSAISSASPGSGTDVTARMLAQILEREKLLPQRVIIDLGSWRYAASGVAGLTRRGRRRIVEGRVRIDMRSVQPHDDDPLLEAIAVALA